MSRTLRKTSYNRCMLRQPKTTNEIRLIESILNDLKTDSYTISGLNRLHYRTKLPTHWDDIVCSSYYQNRFKYR